MAEEQGWVLGWDPRKGRRRKGGWKEEVRLREGRERGGGG